MAVANPFITPDRSTRYYRSSTYTSTRSEFRGLPFLSYLAFPPKSTRSILKVAAIEPMETLEPPEKRRRTSKLDFAHLPNELLEAVLDHLDWFERWSLRVISTRVSEQFHTIGR